MLTVHEIFKAINNIPRPSHHEEKIADFLCNFAKERNLSYSRDENNCVVIRKPASPGHENATPVVILNHGDMVAVSDGSRTFDPMKDPIEAYTENGWMHARGTSLGADNGIGLSMALAILDDDTIIHGPIEVLTTTNEEDGMTGAAGLSADFIRGRHVINLDSEEYDTITVGAAGALIQIATLPITRTAIPADYTFYEVRIAGGAGGHSGVDINKNRCNANVALANIINDMPMAAVVAEFNGGDANASIASSATAIVGTSDPEAFIRYLKEASTTLKQKHAEADPDIALTAKVTQKPCSVIENPAALLASIPYGPLKMRADMPGTVMTSNNIGVVRTNDDCMTISCHTRSFDNKEMEALAKQIANIFHENGASVEMIMNTPGWQERQDSEYLALVDKTFRDVLGFSPRKVAMHFVLEAGYYVEKYPGIEIACIGPRIIEPHSTRERVELSTIDNIYKVTVELLKRMA